jgi:hypothetical protein
VVSVCFSPVSQKLSVLISLRLPHTHELVHALMA